MSTLLDIEKAIIEAKKIVGNFQENAYSDLAKALLIGELDELCRNMNPDADCIPVSIKLSEDGKLESVTIRIIDSHELNIDC